MSNTALSDRQRRLLEAYMQARPEAAQEQLAGGKKSAAGSALPLTAPQKQLWLHAQLAPGTPLYNEPMMVRRTGSMDVVALERSMTEIVRRHEAWRTAFPMMDGEPVQVVQPAFEIKLPVVDLRNLPPAEREAEAQRIALEDAQRLFDLAKGPLFRMQLVRLSDEEFRLVMTLHHIIFDGYSGYRVFLPELIALYEAFSDGKPSPLPELEFEFSDYVLQQKDSVRDEDVEYWKRQLAGAPPTLDLPIASGRKVGSSFAGAMHTSKLPAGLSESLRRFSREAGATPFMTLLAAFNVLLHRYSGLQDILIGSNSAGRNLPGSEKLLGYFLNTIVLRSDLSGEPTFREVVDRVRKVTLDALAHDGVPLDRLVEELQRQRDPNRHPFFQVLFSMEPPLSSTAQGWDLTCIDAETGTSKFELCLVLDDRPDGLLCRFIYSTALFDEASIARMAGHWQSLLEGIAANPECRIGELPLLAPAERQELLVGWSQTGSAKPQACVHELFSAQVQRVPKAVAVQCGKLELTYGDLDQRAERLARKLRGMGVGPNQPVVICVDRSPEMIVGILGVLKAGGTYVPLDPTYPGGRLEFMLADCGAKVLLTKSSVAPFRLSQQIQKVLLDLEDEDLEAAKNGSVGQIPSVADSGQLAYIIYTSGSTGAPKGVQVTHGNLAHSNQARLQFYREPVGKYLLLSSYAFDSSVAGIFHSLTTGGTLVVPPADARLDPQEISRLIYENQATHVLTFPSLYSALLEQASAAQIASLKTVIVAGEACPRSLVDQHYRVLAGASLFNEYGPTEATVWSTVYECEPGESDRAVPIGRPVANTQCYVLDENGQSVPIGVPGELYIGGEGVTAGYLNRLDLTQANYVSNPFTKDPNARLYRTGDLVRWLSDGNLEYLGRRDQQVKINGLRIELGELEAMLAQHPDVREAVVLANTNGSRELHLSAYIATREENQTSSNELRSFLKSRLPADMIPSSFHLMESFPRTPNGKVDRQKLSSTNNGSKPVAVIGTRPRNDSEQRLLGIWQHVLKTDVQDVTQDFFQLGGNSLSAARLLTAVEKEFGKTLSLAFVFQSPTVEQMAESLRNAGQTLRERAIVPIQPSGSNPPLFWIRGGPRFRLLAQKLGPKQPFLGLDLPYADRSALPVPYRFEDIAALLVRAMQEAQPTGPYFLAGLCVNAVLAYEVARQLSEKGEEIGLLALFDGHNQAYYKNPFTDGRYTGRIRYHLANLIHLDAGEKTGYLRDRFDEARRKIDRLVWQLSSERKDGNVGNTDNVVHPAFHRYSPKPYRGQMVLLQSSDWPEGPYFDFKLGWEHLVEGGIEFQRIPGDHPSMFTEPNVNIVAACLKAHLTAYLKRRSLV